MSYDLEKMKAEAKRIGKPFTLFGGEPLMIRFEDLEHLFAWGLETFGANAIQTNGVLIEDRHIDLFRRYKVSVGISIDGPAELNDARWHRGLEKTRQSTAFVEEIIARLCREYQPPGLIVTLHKGNASADKLPRMMEWMRGLHALGIKGVRLHLLEVDQESVRDSLALTPKENIEALLAFAQLQESVPSMHLDLFEEMEQLLTGQDAKVGCIWRACDAYTTEAVQGVEGNGQSSNCGRTNKEGIGFIKAARQGYERYLALYRTPQSENGCSGCRFFLMCKGQCPGTAIDGDWRNRTEHCLTWKELFRVLERRMILAGKVPLTIQPVRLELERRQIELWERGSNPSLSFTLSAINRENSNGAASTLIAATAEPNRSPRISWVSETARDIWQARLRRIQSMLEEVTVHAARASNSRCNVRQVPGSSFERLQSLAAQHGVGAAILPSATLPGAICTNHGLWGTEDEPTGILLTGSHAVLAKAQAARTSGDLAAFWELLNLPGCCLARNCQGHNETIPSGITFLPEAVRTHPLLASLGLSALPILPCRLDCASAAQASEEFLELAAAHDYGIESGWLRECLGWAVAWSELHGVAEIKTPVFKACSQASSDSGPRSITRAGSATVEGSVGGLKFPYVKLRGVAGAFK